MHKTRLPLLQFGVLHRHEEEREPTLGASGRASCVTDLPAGGPARHCVWGHHPANGHHPTAGNTGFSCTQPAGRSACEIENKHTKLTTTTKNKLSETRSKDKFAQCSNFWLKSKFVRSTPVKTSGWEFYSNALVSFKYCHVSQNSMAFNGSL